MSEQPTCGQGLAANASLPASMGEVLAGMAQNLDAHQRALDASDPAAREELIAYIALLTEQRQTADGLRATAQHMTGYRDLPMGKHHVELMTTPQVLDAFAAFVKAEQELLELLQTRIERDRAMLETITANVRRDL
jgi:hypothetical protein